MRNYKKLLLILLFLPYTVQSQNNVRLAPNSDTICYNTSLYLDIAGQSFYPLQYQWSTGETTPTINITQTGVYTLTVTGYMGNSFFVRTYTKSRYYKVLNKPDISFIKGPYVCRFDTVKALATSGYDSYIWYNGETNISHTNIRNNLYGQSQLDTTSIWYTATINGVCSINSDTIVIRGIRAPEGVSRFYCGKLNIDYNDSIPSGLVLEYIYPVQYEMEFTQISNPTNVFSYFPPLGSRRTPANILTPGEKYLVRSRVIINNQTFCWGTICEIGLKPPVMAKATYGYDEPPPQINRYSIDNIKYYRIYNVVGQLLNEIEPDSFDMSMLNKYPKGKYIIQVIYKDNNISYFKY